MDDIGTMQEDFTPSVGVLDDMCEGWNGHDHRESWAPGATTNRSGNSWIPFCSRRARRRNSTRSSRWASMSHFPGRRASRPAVERGLTVIVLEMKCAFLYA